MGSQLLRVSRLKNGKSGRTRCNTHLMVQATSGGTVYHIVKKFKNEKDVHAAWQALCEYHNDNVTKAKMADTMRKNLAGCKMHNRDSTLQYINNFLTLYLELNEIPGEALSDRYALLMSLKGMKDADYETFNEIKKNKSKEGLMDAIVEGKLFRRERIT
eukprot:13420970-Ditylum_brightwellii.AAC.1